MANSHGAAVSHDLIAQEFLDSYRAKLAPVKVFTTDFSNEVATKGAGVVTRIPGAVSARTKEVSGSFTSGDVSVTDVTVNLNQHEYVQFELDETDLAKSMVDIVEVHIAPHAYALAEKVHDYCMGLVTSSNYTNSTALSASQFDYDALVDLEANCDALGWARDKALIVPSTYIATLRKDAAVRDGFKHEIKDDALDNGSIGRLAGFNFYKDNGVPANGEGLKGFAADKRAMAVAMRTLPDAGELKHGIMRNMTDADSGLTVRFTNYMDLDRGKYIYRWDILFGASKGNGDGIWRFTA
jgi:hypothetical protein